MAFTSTSDAKTALFKIVHAMGPDKYSWVRQAGISQADADQIVTEYQSWFLSQGDRIHEAHQTTAHT
jgi:hypothetical protein